jgi:ribosomal protein S18 acetylase RimI-like enzyme
MFEAEAALEACLPIFGRLSGARVVDQGDLRFVASGRSDAALNHIVATRLEPERVAARVAEVEQELRSSGSLPATWWSYSATRPADLATRLEAAGLRPEEPEFGMVYDLALGPPDVPVASGAVLEELAPGHDLAEWMDVMRASYGWTNPTKAEAFTELYRVRPGETPPWTHVLVRVDGRPVASGSLFAIGGQAFVTNIGTIPEARGLGLGSVVTAATLGIAQRQGYDRASLTASVMGRSMYARLGFRDESRLDRLTLAPATG